MRTFDAKSALLPRPLAGTGHRRDAHMRTLSRREFTVRAPLDRDATTRKLGGIVFAVLPVYSLRSSKPGLARGNAELPGFNVCGKPGRERGRSAPNERTRSLTDANEPQR
jgi:hypothetical protein